jgi:hypothetical protein
MKSWKLRGFRSQTINRSNIMKMATEKRIAPAAVKAKPVVGKKTASTGKSWGARHRAKIK